MPATGRSGAYDGFLGSDIYGSTLGVIGMGRIGQRSRVARAASGCR
ncbi:NAD(P)-dependent oxidoreductase [Burkholderia multivorans]